MIRGECEDRFFLRRSRSLHSEQRYVLAVGDMLTLFNERESGGFDFLDERGIVDADVLHGRAPLAHGSGASVVFDDRDTATGLQRGAKAGEHVLRVVEVVIGVEREDQVNFAFREIRAALGAFDERYVGEIIVYGTL